MAVIGNAPFQGLVSGGNIIDASIEGVDLSTSAIAARLGYTPVDPANASLVDTNFFIVDGPDPSKKATFDLANLTTATTRTYTLPDATATLAGLGVIQTWTAAQTFNGSVTLSSTNGTYNISTTGTTSVVTVGGTAATGNLTLGRSTATQITNIQAGATASGNTKTINFGTGGLAGSTTAINIGSSTGTVNVNIDSTNFNINTGNVGIGTTATSTNKLTVFGEHVGGRSHVAIRTSNSSVGAPAIIGFYNSADTRVGSVGHNMGVSLAVTTHETVPIIFNIADTERARIDSSGRLGLGTTSFQTQSPIGSLSFPQGASLQTGSFGRAWNPAQQIGQGSAAGLYGMAHTYLAYYDAGWKSLGGGTASAITIDEGNFSFSNSNGVGAGNSALTWTTRMYINTSGDVGIGTTTPGEKLEVQGNLRLDGPSGTNREIYFRNMGSGDGAAIKSDKALTFYAGSGSGSPTRYMTLLEGGNLGIGTVSPTAKLHINTGTGGTAFIAHASSSSISEVNIGVGVLTAGRPFVGTNTNSNPMEVGTRAAADLVFVTNSAERARINSTGNLLVGYSADTYLGPTTNSLFSYRSGNNTIGVAGGTYTGAQFGQLYLSGGYGDGGSRVSGYFIRSQASGGGGNVNNDLLFVAQTNNGSGGSETERMRIDTNGNVGIGTTSPGARLHVRMSRTSSTSGVALWLSDNVAGGQTDGVFKSIRSGSNGDNSISEIRFVETDGTNNNTAIAFATQATAGGLTERMRVGPDGNTAIGTTNPDGWRLNITGNAISNGGDVSNLLTLRASTNSFLSFRAANEGGTAFQRIISTDGIQLHTSNTERLRINPTGRVTIGYSGNWNDTAPYLHVRDGIVIGSVNSAALFTSIKSSNGYDLTLTANANPANLGVNANIIFSSGNSGGGGPAELMRIISDGRVGMGTASPTTNSRLDVAGPIKSNRTVYNWFQWGGNPSGRYLHIKTNLWAGGAPHGNSQPTMSLFHIRGYNYDAHTIDAMIGFHNWVGGHYSLRVTNAGSYVGLHGAYTSTDGFTVLVIDVSTSYPGISIDYFQSFPYGYVDVVPTASNSSTSATGVY